MTIQKAGVCIILIFVLTGVVSAGIFSIDDAKAAVAIKPITSSGFISKDAVREVDLKTDTLQTVQLELTKDTKVESKTVQMYPGSSFLISDDFNGETNIMQTCTKDGYPLLEVYYGYQKSSVEPWQYYFRVEQIDKDNAYMIYADFATRSSWLGKIPRVDYDTTISSGKIPDWKLMQGG